MSVFFRRRGEPPATTIPVTITGKGNASYCYATINGTKKYSAGTYEVNTGDTITFGVYGARGQDSGWVTIDGTQVLKVTSGSLKTYDWTVPDGISTIEIAMSTKITIPGQPVIGRITVTTA